MVLLSVSRCFFSSSSARSGKLTGTRNFFSTSPRVCDLSRSDTMETFTTTLKKEISIFLSESVSSSSDVEWIYLWLYSTSKSCSCSRQTTTWCVQHNRNYYRVVKCITKIKEVALRLYSYTAATVALLGNFALFQLCKPLASTNEKSHSIFNDRKDDIPLH